MLDALLDRLGYARESAVRRERRYLNRGLDVAETFGGVGSVSGTLTPEVREKFMTALRAAAQPAGPDDHRTPRQRFHDALGEISDVYLAHAETPTFAGAPRTVVVTVPLDVLEARAEAAAAATLPEGIAIGPDAARRLACDAEIIPAVLGTASEVLDLGRSNRVF